MEPEQKRKRGNQGGPRSRPEGERSPEPAPKLTDEDKAAVEAMSDDELFLSAPELECVHISFRTDREMAAKRLGWTLKKVKDTLNKPHVKLYAIRFREDFIKEMVRREVTNSRKKGITPSTVQERLMEIAMMPPADTKGSVDAQVKALQELAGHLGLKKDDPLAGKTTEELQAIVDGAKAPTVN
jgi:hypothetical protein